MKLASFKVLPGIIAVSVVSLACLLHALKFELIEKLEWITFDWRVRKATKFALAPATNLAFVYIDDGTLRYINTNYGYTWPIPRKLYGQVTEELSARGVKAIGFDILFREIAPNDPRTDFVSPDGTRIPSDEYFAQQLKLSSNTILAVMGETLDKKWSSLLPADLFRTNSMAVAHIISDTDHDGLLRRAKAYRDDPELGRIWHMGIALAAQALQVDLTKASVNKGHIFLPSELGLHRKIPIDSNGYFYIDWQLPWNDRNIATVAFEDILQQIGLEIPLHDKLVVVGSTGSGNNISDLGATPLEKETYLVSKHWNVANSILTGRFIQRTSPLIDYFLIVLLGAVAAFLTWELRTMIASVWVVVLLGLFVATATLLYVRFRIWVPVVVPGLGGLMMTHLCIVTYRVVFEQNERRRIRSVFSKMVSPDVVNEVLNAETLSLVGARRKITIFFADVRGFTEMTDLNQVRAEEYVREKKLNPLDAEKYFDTQARGTLETVNLYLGLIADVVKKHDGTLDKYIGDCVMAFWGAPISNERHAWCCVRAAIEVQREIYKLNQERFAKNKRREQENIKRAETGEALLDLLPLLSLGSGINTGMVIVGFMGSEAHIMNYTVFGREVNLASRLEGVSGRGRIIIGESTYLDLARDDPEMAASCVALPPVTVKGIKNVVKIYEVLWKLSAAPVAATEFGKTGAATAAAPTV